MTIRVPDKLRFWFSSWPVLLSLVCASTILLAIFALHLRTTSHWAERLGTLAEGANIMYMLAGVISAASAVLLTGVVVMAPLLSLALHQSHDPMFDLLRLLEDKHDDRANALRDEVLAKLRADMVIYKFFNPFYLALWISSVTLLAAFTLRLLYLPSIEIDAFRDALLFLALSCVLCVLFAFVAVIFFVAVRPGITKLTFFMAYFHMTNNQALPRTRGYRRFWQLAVSAVALAVSLLIAWSILRPANHNGHLTVAINSTAIATSPIFVASEDFARPAGLDLDLRSNASGRAALDALIDGKTDAATAADFPVVLASRIQPNLRIVLVLTESNLTLVARRSKGISSVQDLKGKRIAVLAGASPEYFAERALQAHGVPLSAVHLVNITDPPNMVIALQRGDVDAISIWEPLAAKAMDAVGDDGIEFQDSSAYVEHFCLVTTTAVLADRAKAAMLSRLVETIKHVSQHLNTDSPPDDAVSLIAQRTGIEPNTLRRVWYNFHFPGTLDSSLTDTLRTIEDWEASTNQNPPRSAVELSRLIDTDIERAAR